MAKKSPRPARIRDIDRPNAYQVYSVDAAGQVVHCGVHHFRRVTPKAVRRCERKWLAWRAGYLLANPGSYPLRDDHRPVVHVAVEPIGKPELRKWFRLA